jgi:acyl-CoA thioester hydrolase
LEPPTGGALTTVEHRVAFFETDAMKIVHHANYLRFFELARVRWLEEHDRPYTHWLERGLHFAVTHSEVDYHRAARFDDRLQIQTWLEWIRGASLRMAYRVECDGTLIAEGATEHATVNDEGRLRRIPKEDRTRFTRLLGDSPSTSARARHQK